MPNDLRQQLREAGIKPLLIRLVCLAKEKGDAGAAAELRITQAAVSFRVDAVAGHLRKEGRVELADLVSTER
jgi:hypothetical protein